VRDRRRIIEATAAAAILSGAPSTLDAVRRQRRLRSAVSYIRQATRAVGTLLPPGRPSFVRGAVIHVGISVVCGEALARTLPERHSTTWGAAAGLGLGIVGVGLVGRRFPAIAALPLTPQIADNVAFGAVFAFIVDRQHDGFRSFSTRAKKDFRVQG
jgi:hypothetical protein